jgi:hypothetical protein
MEMDNIKPIAETTPDENLLISLNGRLVPILARQEILEGRFTIQVRAFGGHLVTMTISGEKLIVAVSKQTFELFTQ